MANSLDLQGIANEIEQNLPSREYTLGKGLLQPFNETNSGSRKVMQGIQKEQSIQLCESEVPIIMTGYENQFGTLSSNFITADANYTVIDKIHKNGKKYCILLHDIDNNILHSMMRTEYEYHTELYGFNINSEFLDNSKPGEFIAKGTPLVKRKGAYVKKRTVSGQVSRVAAYCAAVSQLPGYAEIATIARLKPLP